MLADIKSRLERFPALEKILNAVLADWPDHEKFITRSFGQYNDEMFESSNWVSQIIIDVESGDLPGLCRDYRWTCARLLEAEIDFRRSGKYRHTSFAEAEREVYSNSSFMRPYLRGLLLSHVMWFNHAASINFYARTFLPTLPRGGQLLDVGPGHGLMLYLASRQQNLIGLNAWDVSETSIALTRSSLAKLGIPNAVDLKRTDILAPIEDGRMFDAILLCEILEHLENPDAALANLRAALAPGGKLFVSVPINSPAPDHIYLLKSPAEAEQLIQRNGYRLVTARHFPTGGYSLERAIRQAVTISSVLVAERI